MYLESALFRFSSIVRRSLVRDSCCLDASLDDLICFFFPGLDRVLAVFEKPGLSMSEGFPRTLRYVGFRLLPPDAVPNVLSSDKYFVMSYSV